MGSSNSSVKYKQVQLVKHMKLVDGTQYSIMSTVFIPSNLAKEGKIVKIKKESEWDDGWKVAAVYEREVDEEYVLERSQDYKRTRKASDI